MAMSVKTSTSVSQTTAAVTQELLVETLTGRLSVFATRDIRATGESLRSLILTSFSPFQGLTAIANSIEIFLNSST